MRIARMVALDVPEGTAPSAFTPPGRFRATFEGELPLRLRSYVSFFAEGRGHFTLSVNGKPVLDASGEDLAKTHSEEIRLSKGNNHLVAVYESPESGEASVRLFWASKSFRPEPVPPTLFSHVSTAASTESGMIREGRSLLAEFRCIRCHAAPDLVASNDAMPELRMDAPALGDAGARLNADWVAAWVADPQVIRPGAHMPRLLDGPADPRAGDVAAYLATLGKAADSSARGDAKEGGRLFANLDCVACHTPADAANDPTRVPLKHVKAKYKPEALRQYLLKPERHYAWNPMPNFRLSEEESANLAAYLLSAGEPAPAAGGGDAEKGRQWVASVGCLNCHAIGQEKSTAQAPTLAQLRPESLERGCLAATDAARGHAPAFALSPAQRTALAAFLRTDRKSLARDAAPEFAERQVSAIRCTACHARDGVESLLAQSLDAESQALHVKFPNPPPGAGELLSADQRPPMLTWAGEKLRPQWMASFIAGEIPYKPRYYLRARMPAFPARAAGLAAGFAQEHGCPPTLPPEPKPDPDQEEVGRTLVSKVPNAGFSCVQCHAVADVPPFSPFEAPSINFKYSAERLRHDYYARWVRDPLRIDPATKMPRFDDAEGKTGLPTYNGDSARQFEAIWQYLLEGEHIKPPPQ